MAGTVTINHYTQGHVRRIVADFVAHTDGTVPATEIPAIEGRLMELTTNPGATAPQDNWDVTLVDAESVDRLQGVGMNRDTANTETAIPVYSGSTIHPVVSRSDVLTLTIAGNNVSGALGRVILIYGPA